MSRLILMLLLFFVSPVAIAGSLPPLPTDNEPIIEATTVKTENENKESLSFFEKIKSFFGFKKTPAKIITQKIAVQDIPQDEQYQNEELMQIGDNELPVLQESDASKLAELALPSGFQEESTKQTEVKTIAQGEPKTTITTPQTDAMVTPINQNLPSTKHSDDKAVNETKDLSKNAAPNLPSMGQQETKQSYNPVPQITQSQATNIINNKPLEDKPIRTPDQDLPVTKGIKESIHNSKPAIIKPSVGAKLIVPQDLPISRKSPITPRIEQKKIHKEVTDNAGYDDLGDEEDNHDERAKFVSDEAKVLLLPNDDIVLGVLSENAEHELMDISKYLHLFEQYQVKKKAIDQRIVIENFLANYEDNFGIEPSKIELSEAFNESVNAVRKNNLFVLRALLDNYAILQRKNKNNYNLLHYATSLNNYSLVKFLIMRGIDTESFNSYHETPLTIASRHGNMFIVNILRRAQYKR